jgi:hypothetical protein
MALQSTSHPMFAQVPDEFFSPFPSNDSLMSGKYKALTQRQLKAQRGVGDDAAGESI